MGKLAVVGIGPGNYENMTVRADQALRQCDAIVGYHVYVDLVKDRYPEKEYATTPMTKEADRCRMALQMAASGKNVAMVCSGDSGIYGMAALVYELRGENREPEIEVIPGLTAACSGASILGAPLTHDFAVISLSDRLTPWEKIEARLIAAAQADLSIVLYNPASHSRPDYLKRACQILLRYLPGDRICGIAQNIGREGENCRIMELSALQDAAVDMFCTVFIGNQMTKVISGEMVTPRGYVYEETDEKSLHICLFAGTTEGRTLAQFLGRQHLKTTVCVATEYGGERIPSYEGIEVLAGRLSTEEILQLFREQKYDLVIDATHPYATFVTENIRNACAECQIPCHRLVREDSGTRSDAVYVANAREAAEYLKGTDGNILLTTGSKELQIYTSIPDFAERVYARVLPLESSLKSCTDAGLSADHIIAMQGPFSEQLNVAMLEGISAKWMVSKDGGNAGGFAQKAKAAQKTGTKLVVIGRPSESDGASLRDIMEMLCREYGCKSIPEISVIGTGPGSPEVLTQEAREAIRKAGCLIGAERMLKEHAAPGQECFAAVSPEKIQTFIREHQEYQTFAVLMSGDTGFFSGTKKLLPLLDGWNVRVYPGISSLVYLCSKLGQSYEDVTPVSLHGRDRDIVGDVRTHMKVFALVGGENGIKDLCSRLTDAGLGDVTITVGERLSYPEETITKGLAKDLASGTFDSLSVALIANEEAVDRTQTECMVGASLADLTERCQVEDSSVNLADRCGTKDSPVKGIATCGLPDTMFQRGQGEKGIIPMTKSEVRSICLSKLQLGNDSVCWDIGAGTGSVAIEMARIAAAGQVYAIEKEAEPVELIRQNIARFHTDNVTVIQGAAPEALQDLPVPTHVFIGGSGNRMREILMLLLEKNPEVRIVATAISLETVAELTACGKELPFRETETVCVNIARDRQAGSWHLMTGQNPVYVFTLQGGKHAV